MTPPGRQCQGDLSVWIVTQWGGFACGKNLAPQQHTFCLWLLCGILGKLGKHLIQTIISKHHIITCIWLSSKTTPPQGRTKALSGKDQWEPWESRISPNTDSESQLDRINGDEPFCQDGFSLLNLHHLFNFSLNHLFTGFL